MTWGLSSNMKKRALTIVNDNLLPAMHSRLGSAWGDANGDGLEDLYLAGAAGRWAPFLQTGQGSFTKNTSNQVVFNSHRRHETWPPVVDSEGW